MCGSYRKTDGHLLNRKRGNGLGFSPGACSEHNHTIAFCLGREVHCYGLFEAMPPAPILSLQYHVRGCLREKKLRSAGEEILEKTKPGVHKATGKTLRDLSEIISQISKAERLQGLLDCNPASTPEQDSIWSAALEAVASLAGDTQAFLVTGSGQCPGRSKRNLQHVKAQKSFTRTRVAEADVEEG